MEFLFVVIEGIAIAILFTFEAKVMLKWQVQLMIVRAESPRQGDGRGEFPIIG